jgi:threonine/homoserine/homoserine lactone efflux protein
MLGSIFFMASALTSFVLPSTGDVISDSVALAGTLLGAVCFLVGAILMLPAWRHVVRATEPARGEDPQQSAAFDQ